MTSIRRRFRQRAEARAMVYPVGTARTSEIAVVSRLIQSQGNYGALMALHEIEAGKFLIVVYNELRDDGFIITAFLTRRVSSLNRRKQVWPKLP